MIPLRLLVPAALAACLAALAAPGQTAGMDPRLLIPDSETRDPPTRERIQAVEGAAASSPGGWWTVAGPLRHAAGQAYKQDRLIAAEGWYHLFEWSVIFSQPEDFWTAGWNRAMQAAHLGNRPLTGDRVPTSRPLGSILSPELRSWLVENEAFSEEFFSLVRSVDHLPSVFGILEGLRRRDSEKFARYASLALAIAVVYDVEPPSYWPHGQVTEKCLPRKMPNPAQPFERLTREDMLGRTYFRLNTLRAEELKFVVDAAAPAPELAWAEANVPFPLDQFELAYSMIKYRRDRADNDSLLVWSVGPYTLPAIYAQGGICIDQAYFATEAGKARGVPTLLFMGTGQDARHAWFGFLDSQHKWRLDAGRYAELRLVTGFVEDPQTWTSISDHDIQFMAERFRALPTFMQSRVHEEFASLFLAEGDAASAAHAARSAVNYERRNLEAWETLISAGVRMGLDAQRQEAVLREAALAFTPRYPDLVVSYVNRVCQSLRARGETSLANYEERGIADRLKGDRDDLSIKQAAAILSRSIATQPIPEQIATYNAILVQFGHGENTTFFDEIVVAFAEHLALEHLRPDAREAVARAREALDVQPGTQISMDVDRLLTRLQD